MVETIETKARATGAAELALDTAEPATALINWYSRRGYRFIEYAQWHGKRYRSAILEQAVDRSICQEVRASALPR